MSCPSCQQPFYARDIRQLYCSSHCRSVAFRDQVARVTPLTWGSGPLPKPMPWPYREVPVAIVTHPKRLAWANSLAEETNAEAVCLDNNNLGCEVNHLRAWEWLAGGSCPWSVVLEDDAVPVPFFRRQLHSMLRVAPTPIVSLYLGRSRPPHWQSSISRAVAQTQEKDACFLSSQDLLHGVGYAVHTSLIPELLLCVTPLARTMPIDEAVSAWARKRDHQISHCWPSLVDHRDEGTLIAHPDGQPRNEPRKAWYADGREVWEPTVGEIPPPVIQQKEKS